MVQTIADRISDDPDSHRDAIHHDKRYRDAELFIRALVDIRLRNQAR